MTKAGRRLPCAPWPGQVYAVSRLGHEAATGSAEPGEAALEPALTTLAETILRTARLGRFAVDEVGTSGVNRTMPLINRATEQSD